MYAPRGLPLIPRASLAAALDMFAAARDFEHAYGYGLVLDEAVAVGCRWLSVRVSGPVTTCPESIHRPAFRLAKPVLEWLPLK
jgi:hypothetical protein